jgi:hypothetical protein
LFFCVLLDNPHRHGHWLIGTKRCDLAVAIKESFLYAFACCGELEFDHVPCGHSSPIEC